MYQSLCDAHTFKNTSSPLYAVVKGAGSVQETVFWKKGGDGDRPWSCYCYSTCRENVPESFAAGAVLRLWLRVCDGSWPHSLYVMFSKQKCDEGGEWGGCRGGSRPAGGSVTPAREMCCTEGHAAPTETLKNSLIVKGSGQSVDLFRLGRKYTILRSTNKDIRGEIIISLDFSERRANSWLSDDVTQRDLRLEVNDCRSRLSLNSKWNSLQLWNGCNDRSTREKNKSDYWITNV